MSGTAQTRMVRQRGDDRGGIARGRIVSQGGAGLLRFDAGAHLPICKPQIGLDRLIGAGDAAGCASAQVHREYFWGDVELSGDTFDVHCDQSDVTLTVGPADTITKVLAKAGILVKWTCEEGGCGTCITDVLDGENDHRDHSLTEDAREDGDQMCVCCFRAKGLRLVLDI